MSTISPYRREAFLIELAEVMAAAGEDRDQREAAARRAYLGCPTSLILEADRKAVAIIEFEFLRPLAAHFADAIDARDSEERRYSSSDRLDSDIPF